MLKREQCKAWETNEDCEKKGQGGQGGGRRGKGERGQRGSWSHCVVANHVRVTLGKNCPEKLRGKKPDQAEVEQ